MLLGQKKLPFLLSFQITFYEVVRPFFLAQSPSFRKAINISNSVSRSSVNFDCCEIDLPDEVIRVEQRSGLYADTCLGLKYFLVSNQKL